MLGPRLGALLRTRLGQTEHHGRQPGVRRCFTEARIKYLPYIGSGIGRTGFMMHLDDINVRLYNELRSRMWRRQSTRLTMSAVDYVMIATSVRLSRRVLGAARRTFRPR